MEIFLDDIYALASGIDEEGRPNSACSLFIAETVPDSKGKVLQNEYLNTAVEIHATNGAAVCVMDFPAGSTHQFMNALKSCLSWLNNGEGQALFLFVVPVILHGKLNIAFGGLTYCDFYTLKNGKKRLIMVFDNTETVCDCVEDAGYEELKEEVEAALKRTERELDEEIFALEKEQERLNEIAGGFHYEFDSTASEEERETKKDEPEQPGVRFVSGEGEADEES